MNWSAALPTFVITLREGVEAALVVGIVLAYLKRVGRSQLHLWVWAGVGVGIATSAMVGVGLSQLVQGLGSASQQYGPVVEPLLEGLFSVLAIALLTWMLVWMTQQSRFLKSQVEGAVGKSLQRQTRQWGIFILIWVAVLREGFEAVLFITAKLQEGVVPALGAIAGVSAAAVIGIALFRLGIRIDIRQFFYGMGILLLLIVAGLVVTALGLFDTALSTLAHLDRKSEALCFFYERFSKQPACILGPMVWNTSKILPADRFPGILFSAFFGYTDTLYVVQFIAYLGFLLAAGSLYFRSLGKRPESGRLVHPRVE
ncbi:membrane protein [Neosynechococcus sphagnicola sy1]|uniref:Membrane protein n=1 Tax=Neosynechococcus sphagnicola sy1 TaxID=1497020 RepID=A0A098TM73_9CYAN|nr:FTR1 family protein [Neosynechococcus sphagnicola]KGF73415.1 membrane protein [Neosynechococcus sphagnicola sy1]